MTTSDKTQHKFDQINNFLSPGQITEILDTAPRETTGQNTEQHKFPTRLTYGNSQPSQYWSDWEDYACGPDRSDKSDLYETPNSLKHSSSSDKPTNVQKSKDEPDVIPGTSTAPCSELMELNLSQTISNMIQRMNKDQTSEEFVQIMMALKLIGAGMDDLRKSLKNIKKYQDNMTQTVGNMGDKLELLESQMSLVMDKIDDINSPDLISSDNVQYFKQSLDKEYSTSL